MTSKPQGPRERFAITTVAGIMWCVYDRKTNRYVNTIPRRFYARESALLCAFNLNRGRSPRVDEIDAIIARGAAS